VGEGAEELLKTSRPGRASGRTRRLGESRGGPGGNEGGKCGVETLPPLHGTFEIDVRAVVAFVIMGPPIL